MGQTICKTCGARFCPCPANMEINGKECETTLATLCSGCESENIGSLYAVCGNCGGPIFPGSHVAAPPGIAGEPVIFHTTYECSPPGGTFYGYWGDGKLVSSFNKIEQR